MKLPNWFRVLLVGAIDGPLGGISLATTPGLDQR